MKDPEQMQELLSQVVIYIFEHGVNKSHPCTLQENFGGLLCGIGWDPLEQKIPSL